MVMWQGALDVQAGRLSGGTIAAFVLTGASSPARSAR
jgi:ATP-binding cassette subfamily B protein